MSESRWIVGEFEGEYRGDPAGRPDPARRTYEIRLLRGTVHRPRLVDAPPAVEAGAEPFREAMLDDALLAVGPYVDGWVRARLFDVRIDGWTASDQIERDGHLHGTVRGRLVAALDRPAPPVPAPVLPPPALVVPQPPPAPPPREAPKVAAAEAPPAPGDIVEPVVRRPMSGTDSGCLPWVIGGLLLLSAFASNPVLGSLLTALALLTGVWWALRWLWRATVGRLAAGPIAAADWRLGPLLTLVMLGLLFALTVREEAARRARPSAPPRLEAVPSRLEVGPAAIGCRGAPARVALHNVGGEALEITAMSLAPDPADFEIERPKLPLSLAAGAKVDVPVRLAPREEGRRHAELVVTTTTGTSTRVALAGTGVASTRVEDRFTIPSEPLNDVLLVVDDSGSMEEEQQRMADNAAAFVEAAARHGADFRIGVVTTDASRQRGVLRPFPDGRSMLTRGVDVVASAAQLAATLRGLGTGGSSDEQGLAAVEAVLDATTGPTADFLRRDARLTIVIVSDEDDHSPRSPEYYVDRLAAAKGPFNDAMVAVSAVVGDGPHGCGRREEAPGVRYLAVQRATGGTFRSICAPDWGRIAEALPLTQLASPRGFALTRPFGEGSVRVAAAGAGTQRSVRGTVDPRSNVLRLDERETLATGDELVVSYEARCR